MKSVRDCLVPQDATLRQVIETIDRGAAKIALVVDDQRRLLGTVSDGDVRRGLLRGATLDSSVSAVIQRAYTAVRDQVSVSEVVALMRSKVISQIPVVDEAGRVVGLHLLEEMLGTRQSPLPNAAVLMAGGKGQRLRPLTDTRPKPMLPVGGRPMLEIILENCIESGIRQFYFSVGYLKQQIIEHFGDGSRWNVAIQYLEEHTPLGTAGALQLLPEPPTSPLLVMNGDVLTRLNARSLLDFHAEHDAAATLCVREHGVSVPYGVVEVEDGKLVAFEEKPTIRKLVNAGIYVIGPQLLDLLSSSEPIDMPELLIRAQRAGQSVAICPVHEYWLDVGRPQALAEADDEWAT